jgi:hypothetical protein
LLEEKTRLFESLLESYPDALDLRLARALNLTALGKKDEACLAIARPPVGAEARSGPVYNSLAHAIAELTARTYGLRPLGPTLADGGFEDRDDVARAEGAVRFIAARTAQLGLEADAIPAIAWQMREMVVSTASYLRFLRKHEEARRINRRFGALAAACVRAHPGRAEPYLLVCEALLQDAKNASRAGDRANIEGSLRHSFEAALKAQAVDPGSDDARRFVIDRRQRLAAFESERKPEQAGSPRSRP